MNSSVAAVAASSIVVARPAASTEFLLVRRPDTSRVLGGFHSFPGGAVETHDGSAQAVSLLTEQQAWSSIGDPDVLPEDALGIYVCGLRELFEETGVLVVEPDPGPDWRANALKEMSAGQSFVELLQGAGCMLGTHRLKYLWRRRSPAHLSRRFDTFFFLLDGTGAEAHRVSNEIDECVWWNSVQSVAAVEAGLARMAPPTITAIGELGGQSFEQLFSQGPVHVGEIQVHSPLVRRLVAPNASLLTGPGTNCYLVGVGPYICIDPGSFQGEFIEKLADAGPISTIVLTHSHADHLAGCLDLAQRTGAPVAGWSRERLGLGADPLPFDIKLQDMQSIEAHGCALSVLHTPGHCPDHISLYLEAERSLFSGDLIAGEGTTLISPPEGDVASYTASLRRILDIDFDRLYPGHFAPRDDGRDWTRHLLEHRESRDIQILNCVSSGNRTIKGIVGDLYSAYPGALYVLAERQVLAHLMKLEAEGLVVSRGGDWFVT